jgi:hypothetical protein
MWGAHINSVSFFLNLLHLLLDLSSVAVPKVGFEEPLAEEIETRLDKSKIICQGILKASSDSDLIG